MSEFQEVVKEGAIKVVSKVKRFLLIILGLAILGGAIFIWVSGWTFSEGTRAGELIKISRKGVVFKTFEGQVNLGGFESDADGIVGNIWSFSTTDKKVYKQLQELEGKKIKLHYKQRYKPMIWQGKTEYFVEKIELIE